MQGKHLNHALSINKKWWRERLKHYFGFDVWKLPVCERCEGYALWHKDRDGNRVGACQCGHITKNPITVEEYYSKGYHVDRTALGRDEGLVVDRQIVKPKEVATIYGGEADLPDKDKKILVVRS